MRTFNQQIQTNVVLSADRTSVAVPLKNIFMYSIAFIVTGTPTGTVKLEVSNDPETNDTMPSANPQPAPVNWIDLGSSSFSLSAAGETFWNVRDVAYNWVRVVYTDSSSGASTATATTIVNCKGT